MAFPLGGMIVSVPSPKRRRMRDRKTFGGRAEIFLSAKIRLPDSSLAYRRTRPSSQTAFKTARARQSRHTGHVFELGSAVSTDTNRILALVASRWISMPMTDSHIFSRSSRDGDLKAGPEQSAVLRPKCPRQIYFDVREYSIPKPAEGDTLKRFRNVLQRKKYPYHIRILATDDMV